MKRIIAIVIFSSLMCVTSVFAQSGSHWSLQYDISFGTGDLGEFISKASFRGASLEYRYAVNDNLLIGGDLAWNVFYEKKEVAEYTYGTRTLSGVQFRYQNEVPILISADYMIMPGNAVQPYIGFGLGTMYTERSVDMGTWRLEQNPWQFALKPELGVLVEVSNTTFFKLSAKYYNGFKTKDLENQGYFTISTGIAWGF